MKYLIEGEVYEPILFGDEDGDWAGVSESNPTCPDCGVAVGEQHLECCDVERCPRCGLQFISCDCGIKYNLKGDYVKHLQEYIEQQKIDNILYRKEIEVLMKKQEEEKKKTEDSEM